MDHLITKLTFEFQKSGRCIPKSWLCDSDLDCGEGDTSDEGPECEYPTCLPSNKIS